MHPERHKNGAVNAVFPAVPIASALEPADACPLRKYHVPGKSAVKHFSTSWSPPKMPPLPRDAPKS